MNRILWADDEIHLLKPYIIYLQEKGYHVTPVNNGQDAIDACREEQFDIVFLDENMPGLSGLEALQEIKEAHPTLPVVMITKSEEEHIMEQAIGQKIADYLIKPVNPSQILLCLKKHIHQREIVEEHTNTTYRQEFSDITYMIDTANTIEEWMAIERTLTRWELELEKVDSAMHDMLRMQREQANKAFAKYIAKNYESWWANPATRPTLSQDVMKKYIFPLLDEGEKVFFVVIDNFRYDQWKIIQPLLSEWFTVKEEQMYTSMLPTATQYARNAIFSGLSPLQIQEMYPHLWIDEDEEESKKEQDPEDTNDVTVGGYTTLKWGATGPDVKKLQQALKKCSYYVECQDEYHRHYCYKARDGSPFSREYPVQSLGSETLLAFMRLLHCAFPQICGIPSPVSGCLMRPHA